MKWKIVSGWLIGAVVTGGLLTWISLSYMNKHLQLVDVYVAKQSLPIDEPVSKDNLVKVQRPKSAVPDDAITDPDKVDGLYANTTILKDQVVEQAALSDAKTLREVVRNFGLNYGALTIPIDTNDFPIDQIHAGDSVDVIGVFPKNTPTGTELISQYVAENVPVISIISDSKSGTPKIVVAVTREDALSVARDLSAGKIRVMLDPRKFVPRPGNDGAADPKSVQPVQTPLATPSTNSGGK